MYQDQSLPVITVEELSTRLANDGTGLQLIDVREPEEVAIAYIEGFEVLPLSQFAQWSEEIDSRFDPNKETFVICHHGMRSAQMCLWLLNNGFSNVKNIRGGIAAYSLRVDSSIPQY
ncbi:rhodanese-like domain-containing protein [Crocosphaera sp. UHCC 0190]|uniref:rhodanese-like domain-containing protein n=1 Tax=Crocosphaera sp. UHCC 0190 TaxID=3110246 RepID=UPI002B1E9E08|nr:rhodanese-like domain-containing protein [Crocosphaera sp. UHCC 0190]MEA5510353.1 rhodanese-like domain-containing protein [Crocosphaera sp. UHCC 0190]